MESSRTVSLSDLLRDRRPLTGAAFLQSSPASVPSAKRQMKSPPNTIPAVAPLLPSLNSQLSTLTPLTHPAVLIGTIELPSLDSPCLCGSHNRCLSFYDGASRVCCDVLELDVEVIGRKVRVLAWNFVPFTRVDGGVLEIIKMQLWKGDGNCEPHIGSYSVTRGLVRSVSPVFAVPGGVEKKDGVGSLGFIVELGMCECNACKKRMPAKDCLSFENIDQHCFSECVFIYFYGPGFCWHPVLGKTVGSVIVVSSLKKKMVFVGHEESYLMLVSTKNTVVRRCWCPIGISCVSKNAIPRSDELGTYDGMVTGVYMKEMVVELDEKVWLLLTDPLLSMPHSVRIGAFISVRNAHFAPSNFSWTRTVIIGTCTKTSINVKSFSPYDAQCSLGLSSQSLFGKFINSLTISARLWGLSDEEIFGSKLKEGFAQRYAKSCLPLSVFQSRKGVFMEFCKHAEYGCRIHPKYLLLDLVAPLSNFFENCKEMWMSALSSSILRESRGVAGLFCEGHSFDRLIRKIISSKDLGIVLMGTLRNSSSTGRLQLSDETGSVDVVIPDMHVDFDADVIYQIKDYKLVIEGLPQQIDQITLYRSRPLSCGSIFKYPQILNDIAGLTVYIHFYTRSLVCISDIFGLSKARNNTLLEDSMFFHLLVLKHKFSSSHVFQDKPVDLNRSCGFAEAIVLPYDLILTGEYDNVDEKHTGFHSPSTNAADLLALTEKWWSMKSYSFHVPDRTLLPGVRSCPVHGEKYFLRIPCLLSASGKIFRGFLIPSNLYHTNLTSCKSTGKQSVANILLEFKKDAFYSYQSLFVGAYYLLKENFYDKVHNKDYLKYGKATLTSRSCLWRFMFCLQKNVENRKPLWNKSSKYSSVGTDESMCSDMQEDCLRFNQFSVDSEIQLQIFSQDMQLLNFVKHLDGNMSIDGSYLTLNDVLSVTSCIETMSRTPLQLGRTTKSEHQLSEGTIVSLHGDVMDVHFLQPSSFNRSYFDGTDIDAQRGVVIICIHVHENNHMVKVQGSFAKNVYPPGIGAGANMTFYRLLVNRNSSRWCKLSIIPSSFLVVNSVKEVRPYKGNMLSHHLLTLQEHQLCAIPLETRFQSSKRNGDNVIRIRCRVDHVLMLVLKKEFCMPNDNSYLQHGKRSVRIQIARFVMDDGSSCFCCWADAERAEMILQLQKSLFRYSIRRSSKFTGSELLQNSSDYLLDSILKKYHKVTIKNYGEMQEPNVKITFSANPGKIFNSSDETFLKSVIFYAGKGPTFDLVGILMDINDPERLMKTFDMDIPERLNMRNIWVTEVDSSLCSSINKKGKNGCYSFMKTTLERWNLFTTSLDDALLKKIYWMKLMIHLFDTITGVMETWNRRISAISEQQ